MPARHRDRHAPGGLSVVFRDTNTPCPSENHAKTHGATLEWRINSISMRDTSEIARFRLGKDHF